MKPLPFLFAALSLGAAGDELGSLRLADAWLNSPPLTQAGLRGKVVLVQFWTYTCINWLRTEPYIRAWAEKYRDQGLVVIGVHAPEFAFEKDLDNVRRMVKELNVPYPVAVDNRQSIWRAFENNYWPALYLIDAEGRVRHSKFGEGDYEELERAIQKLLMEAGKAAVPRSLVSVEGLGAEAPADWGNLRSPENYLGSGRTEGFAASPVGLRLNQWALTGDWTIGRGSVTSRSGKGRILYRFHARDLHLVMGPAVRGKPVRFRVLIDGEPPGAAHGSDVDAEGYGVLDQQRLYQLIRQQRPIGDRLFEIEFLGQGAEAFSFTFG